MVALKDDFALGVEEEEMRDTLNLETVTEDALQVEKLVVIDLQFGNGYQRALRLVLDRDAYHFQTFPGVFVVQPDDIWNLFPARCAPASPEVEQHILSLPRHLLETRDDLTFLPRHHTAAGTDGDPFRFTVFLVFCVPVGDYHGNGRILPDTVAAKRNHLFQLFVRSREDP